MKQGWIQTTTNNAQEDLSPKTLADTVYLDETEEQTVKDAITNTGPLHFQATFPAEGWTGNVPHTQTVPVEGLLETDTPIADVLLDDNPSIAAGERAAYRLVKRMDAENGQVTAYCHNNAPKTAFTVRLMVIR